MKLADLAELHYIAPIANAKSILSNGILSHQGAQAVKHHSVADPIIQARRKSRRVPGALRLHEYVNLYFTARNPMLFRRKAQHHSLAVLRVDPGVLELPGVVICDGNASSDYTKFLAAPSGIAALDHDLIYAEHWTSDDPIDQWNRKRVKCAEVLVPTTVPPEYLLGAYVSGQRGEAALRLEWRGSSLQIDIDSHMFFIG
jgi:hypothetical protein